MTTIDNIDFYKVNCTKYGNPRYVVHYLALDNDYQRAHQKALALGGEKYRGAWFGGGFVFVSYNLQDLATRINKAATSN